MDFFEQQAKAHRKTKWLILYFSLAVISMIVMIYAMAVFVSGYLGVERHHGYDNFSNSPQFNYWNATLFGEVALGTIIVIFLGSAYKTMALAGGGGAVAESLGGRLLASNSNDPDERKLLNVVEEMSIASGVPMPQVYVLDRENGINAFAAGHTTSDAAVTVTRGCLKTLSRDELQGVIGHEFSHILNGDMKLNVRLIGILFGIFCIATIGRVLLYMRSSDSRDKNPLPLVGILLLIIGSLGLFFGRLIQAAVSRQREFLADASSVQFTRNPAGLSGALQKIGGSASRLSSPHASDASHLFFANGLADSLFGALATHPPLEQRIKAIDPTWDGKFKYTDLPAENDLSNQPRARNRQPVFVDGKMVILGGAILDAGAGGQPPPIKPRYVLPNLGNPTPLHLKYAADMRAALPDSLQAAVREPLDSVALIYALLLSPDEKLRASQLAQIAQTVSSAVSEKTVALAADVARTATAARLPLVNLALGALKQLSAEQFQNFSTTLNWLIQSDGEVGLFEFVLQKIVQRHLAPKFGAARMETVQFYTLKPLVPDCAVVLSALAHVGSGDANEIQKAFDTGAPYVRAADDSELRLQAAERCGVDQIGPALDRLAQAVPIIKKNLLEACAHVVGADGIIQESEAELLRAVADTLDCPMPPLGVTE
ncbi:MAG TPA: M48 family metallopeptidase [Verrucomicrobiae bacterium]|jgi:Zn-dependent protease with chaperone function